MIDSNVYLSRWPCRRLPHDETASLVALLRRHGVEQAWAGSFDALLHRDLGAVNERLAAECRTHGDGLLIAFGAVNPKLPDWEEDLRRCHEVHHMSGIRLHPNYHGYRLDDPLFARLLTLAAERELVVQLAVTMEDERTQHPLLQVPHVDTAPLVSLVEKLPKLRLVLLNAFRSVRGETLDKLVAAGRVYFEIAMLEGLGGLERIVEQVPAERLLLGSYAPFYVFESALLKLRESRLGGVAERRIQKENAAQLLGPAR